MHGILWPSLFEYLNQPEYARAASVLCKSLAHIASTKRAANAEDFEIKFENFINIPKPFEILARLIVISGVPLVDANKNRAQNALAFMRNMAPIIDPLIIDLWDNAVPKLITNLEGYFYWHFKKTSILKLLTLITKFKINSKIINLCKKLGKT